MRHVAAVMPCTACRTHLGAYLRTHNFVIFGKRVMPTGAQVRDAARYALHTLHNAVNVRLEKPVFLISDIYTTYGGNRERGEILLEIQTILETLKEAWTPLLHTRINSVAFHAWRTHMNIMTTLATCGSQ
jgi:hypothetical protein